MNKKNYKPIVLLFLLIFSMEAKGQYGWIRNGETRAVSYGQSIATDNSGNVYVTGNFFCDLILGNDTLKNVSCGNPVFPTPLPIYDGYVAKYSEDGDLIWSAQIKGSIGNLFQCTGIDVDNAGNSYITGYYKGSLDFNGTVITNSLLQEDMFVAKYLADGSFSWVKGNFARRPASQVKANNIAVDVLTGNSYVAGAYKDTAIFFEDTLASPTKEFFIAMYNSSGTFQWVLNSAGDSSSSSGEIFDLKFDGTNGLYVTGTFSDTLNFGGSSLFAPGANEIFIVKYKTSPPSLRWALKDSAVASNGLTLDNTSENIFIAGQFRTSAKIGTNTLTTVAGNRAAFIAKYDTAGVYKWSRTCTVASGDSSVTGRSVGVDQYGSSYLSGSFGKKNKQATISSGTISKQGKRDLDAFVAKFSDAGAIKWIQVLGDTLSDDGVDIEVRDTSRVFLTGLFSKSMRVDTQVVKNTGSGFESYTARIDHCPFLSADISAAGAVSFCRGDSVLLQATTGAGLAYQWQKNGVNIPGATSSIYYASDSASYRVRITNAAIPCTKYSLPLFVKVNPLPVFTVTANKPLAFCEGSNVTLSSKIGFTSYKWLDSTAVISGAVNYNYTTDTSGKFRVVITNQYGCRDTSATFIVKSYVYPEAVVAPAGVHVICDSDSLELSVASGAGYKYQWKRNSINLTNDTLSTYQAKIAGDYSIEIRNAIGCATISDVTTLTTIASPNAVITASGDLAYCAGTTPTTLFANAGIGLSYQWKDVNGDLTGENNDYYVPVASGTYTVVVKAGSCERESAPVDVTINAQPAAIISPAGTSTFCAGDSLTLSANAGAGLTYQWKINGGNISGATDATYKAKTAGNYTLTVTNAANCSATSAQKAIIVNGLPPATATAQGPVVFCTGDQVELRANPGSGLSWQWRNNGSDIPAATGQSYFANTSGSYDVVVSNLNNCKRISSAIDVTVYSIPPAAITPGGPVIFCQGDSVTLNANTGAGLTYQWKKDGFNISAATADFYRAKTSGNYSVVVSVTPTCFAESSTQAITVKPIVTPIVTINGLDLSTSFYNSYQWNLNGTPINGATNQIYKAEENGVYTVTVVNNQSCSATSAPVSMCVPRPVITVSGSLLTSTAGIAYQWYLDNNLIGGAVNQTLLAQASGSYKVRLTDNSSCQSFSDPVIVCIPAPAITVGANNVLTASNGISYQWYVNAVEIPGATTQVHVADVSGSYTVKVKNAQNCESISLPVTVTATGIAKTFAQYGVEVYPNPAASSVNVRIDNAFTGSMKVAILDMLGREQKSIQFEKTNIHFNEQITLQDLPEGIYILKIIFSGNTVVGKIEKNN